MEKNFKRRPYITFTLDLFFIGVSGLGLFCMFLKINSGSEKGLLAFGMIVTTCLLSTGFWFQSKKRGRWTGKADDKSKYKAILKEY